MSNRIIITSALPYSNGPLHIGHLAGVYIPSDIYARFQRRKEKEVLFISGSDEYGVAITISAKKKNKTPEEIVNFYHKIIKNSLINLGISFDYYGRTFSKIHHTTVQEFFLHLVNRNKLIEIESYQFYDIKANEFLADRYIFGTCPYCQNMNSYGDQCEQCGKTLSPNELVNPKSIFSNEKPILKLTKHWYIPLNKYEKFIINWFFNKKNKYNWKNNVYGQVKSWIEQGLKARSITRDLSWGVPVPLKNYKNKVLYVWFDAPIAYISIIKEWCIKNNKYLTDYWNNHNNKLIHFIGKDNIVFHCIIFPIMLYAHGEYILPNNVIANEFLNLENQKISTSKEWAIWVHEYLIDFPNKEDVLRYVLIINAPENKDNNFTWKDFQIRNNNDLVGILGNFVNRVLVLTEKYYHGKVPNSTLSQEHFNIILKYINKVDYYIEKFQFRNGLLELMNFARFGNSYLQNEEPWKKTNVQDIKNVIFFCIQLINVLAQTMEIFMPFTSKKILKILNWELKPWSQLLITGIIPINHQFNVSELLFEKIDDYVIQKQINKLYKINESI